MSKVQTLVWGDRAVVFSVDASSDGRWVAAGALFEPAFCVWELATGSLVAEHHAAMKDVAVGTEVRFRSNGSLAVRLNAHSTERQAELEASPDAFKVKKKRGARGICLPVPGPSGMTAIVGKPSQRSKWKCLAEVYDSKGKRLATIKTVYDQPGLHDSVADVDWLPDGSLVVAHETSLGAGVYDPVSGELVRRLQDAPNRRRYRGNNAVAVHPAGVSLATTRQDDRTARVWQLQDGALLHELGGHAKTHVKSNSYHPLKCRFGAGGATLLVNAGQKKGKGAVSVHRLTKAAVAVVSPPPDDEADALAVLIAETEQALSKLDKITARAADPILRHYLKRGAALGCSPLELHDHFSISSPTMPERAGLDAKQCAAAEKRFAIVSRKIFAS